MNAKVLSSLSAALVVASFVPPAIAAPLGEHPAVLVARTWNNRGIDANTFIVAPPASTRWVQDAPKAAPKAAHELTHVSESTKIHWTAAIGTGHATGTTEASRNIASSVTPDTAATNPSHSGPGSLDWTATIGTGKTATSRSAVPSTKVALSSGTQPTIMAAHWTSRIGAGHAFDSTSPLMYTSVADAR